MTALFVVLTFILFIAIDMLVLKAQKKKHPAFIGAEDKPVFNTRNIAHPENVFISKGHLWVKAIDDNNAKIGIDDFVIKALGAIKLLPAVNEGNIVNKGDTIFTGQGNNFKISFRSPIKCIIKNINKPESFSHLKDPFNNWVLEISSNELTALLPQLKSGGELTNWLKQEFTRLKDFVSANSQSPELAGVTMQDGGNIVEGVLSLMDKNVIKSFEEQFLS